MGTGEILFLALILIAFLGFAGTLAYYSRE
jgi:hypothetical protein